MTVEDALKTAGEEAVYYHTRLTGASNRRARGATRLRAAAASGRPVRPDGRHCAITEITRPALSDCLAEGAGHLMITTTTTVETRGTSCDHIPRRFRFACPTSGGHFPIVA